MSRHFGMVVKFFPSKLINSRDRFLNGNGTIVPVGMDGLSYFIGLKNSLNVGVIVIQSADVFLKPFQ